MTTASSNNTHPRVPLTRTDFYISAGLLLAAFVPLARALLLPGTIAYSYDIPYHYAIQTARRLLMEPGHLPLWNPYWWAGMPLLANPQASLAYPFTWLVAGLPLPEVFDWGGLLHLWLAGLGVYAFMKDAGVSRAGAALSGLAWMLSGAIVPRFNAGHVHFLYSLAWIGWLLFAYRRTLFTRKWYWFVASVVALALIVVAGHPHYSAIILIIPAVYSFVYPFEVGTSNKLGSWLFATGVLGGIAILALGLAAIQVVPTLELLALSARSGSQLTFVEATNFQMTYAHLLHLFAPYGLVDTAALLGIENLRFELVHEMSPYVGLITLWLAFAAAFRKPRALVRAYSVFALIGLLLALGENTPVYGLLYRAAPVVRAPGRFLAWWAFGLAVSAGVYLDVLKQQLAAPEFRAQGRLRRAGNLLAVLVLGVAVVAIVTKLYRLLPLTFLPLVVSAGGLALVLQVAGRGWLSPEKWGWLAVVVLAVDLVIFAWIIVPPEPVRIDDASSYALLTPNPTAMRIGTVGRIPIWYGFPASGGEEPAITQSLASLIDLGMEPGERGSQVMAAGFVVTDAPLDDPAFDLVQQADGAYLYEHKDNWPRIIAAPAVEVVATDDEALARVADPAFDPFAAAVVTAPDVGPDLPAGSAGALDWAAAYTCYEADRICATVETGAPALVVFSEMAYPGWEATLDGVPARIWQANYALRGIAVGAGKHTIEMRFRPRSVRIGAMVSGATLLVLLGGSLFALIRRRRV